MRPMTIVRIVVLLIAVAMGIYRGATGRSSGRTRIAQSGETVVERAANDPELAAAAQTAHAQWGEFVSEFNRKAQVVPIPLVKDKPSAVPIPLVYEKNFAVKIPLAVKGGGSEHIWMNVTAIEGDTIRGTLANDPMEDVGYQNGDALSVQANTIEDWIITEDGKTVRGGFSVAILKNRK